MSFLSSIQARHKTGKYFLSFVIVLVLIFTLLIGANQASIVKASSTSLTFTPVADTYTNQSAATANYGTNASLRVDASPMVRSYLRFDVKGLPAGTVSKATLSVYANSASSVGFSVRKIADNSWAESQVNYNNAPALGALMLTSQSYSANVWVNFDVTSYIKANGIYSLALTTGTATATNLAARESGAHAPKLIVEITSTVPTAVPTHIIPPTATNAAPTNPAPTSVPVNGFQPAFPIRAAFYYPWFPEAWNQAGFNPFTNYTPTAGNYDSGSVAIIQNHIKAMTYGNINAAILSWWGQGSPTDKRVNTILNATASSSNPNFRWSMYYENESLGNPSQSQIQSDLTYIQNNYAKNPAFLKVNGKFVMFVYSDSSDACGMADRWVAANKAIGNPAYIVLKVFSGYLNCASKPDSWHQYSPAVATDQQSGYSFAISPGFWLKGQTVRLARDLNRWTSNVKAMVASGEKWQLVTTFNEWGEGTIVESAAQWASASGYGQYLDALHNNGGAVTPPPATPGVQPTNPPASTAVPTKVPPTAQPTNPPANTPLPTRAVTNTPVPTQPAPQPTATQPGPVPTQPATCSAVILTKGPTLIFTGNNTQMRVFWQWNANSAFTVQWGTSTAYGSSASVSAMDTTNHLYQYDISGLNPGSKYYYRVVTGSQCASGSFNAAPAASAASVKFFSYGDTRTNGSTHNAVAGQVDAAFAADPACQTLNINVGDWVSGDSESAWTSEYFNPAYTNVRKQDANITDIGVRGNHESGATYWKRYWPEPFQSSGLYWSFDYGPMHVVFLDQYTSYTPGSAQYNWLKADLAASTKTWKFVAFHEPGWSAAGGHSNNTTVQQDLQSLFTQYGVSIVFAGHNHYYARASVSGVTHLTMGGGGAPSYTPASGQPNIVKTYQGSSFGEFSITGNTLTAQIISGSGSVVDTFTITR
jgi:hypothetical protein